MFSCFHCTDNFSNHDLKTKVHIDIWSQDRATNWTVTAWLETGKTMNTYNVPKTKVSNTT